MSAMPPDLHDSWDEHEATKNDPPPGKDDPITRMSSVEKERIYYKARQKWGREAQRDMVIEECAELIKAICKKKRFPNQKEIQDNLVEEIADVEIMLEQLKLDICDSKFDLIKEEKLSRLKFLVEM